jgi:hypothetical protein
VDGALVQTEDLSHCIEQFGWWLAPRVTHMIPLWWCPEIADNRHRAKLLETQFNITLSGQICLIING